MRFLRNAGTIALVAAGACSDGPATTAVRLSRESGQVTVQTVLVREHGYETYTVTQPVMKLQREGRPAKIAANGDAVTVSPRHFVSLAANLTDAAAFDRRPNVARKHLVFGHRGVSRGHTIDLYSLDARPGRFLNDPDMLLVLIDQRLTSSVQISYSSRGRAARMTGFKITDYDDQGRARRLVKYTFTGFSLGCDTRVQPASAVERVLARAGALVLPRPLLAQSVEPCIPGISGLPKEMAFELISEGLGNPALLEAYGTYSSLEWVVCAIEILITPQLPTVTVSCPPCPLVTTWETYYDPLTGEELERPVTAPQCPDDDSNCTVTGIPPAPFVP